MRRLAIACAATLGATTFLWMLPTAAERPSAESLAEDAKPHSLLGSSDNLVDIVAEPASRSDGKQTASAHAPTISRVAAEARRLQFRTRSHEPLALTRIDVQADAGDWRTHYTDRNGWVEVLTSGITGSWNVKTYGHWLGEGNPPGLCPPYEAGSAVLTEAKFFAPGAKYLAGQRLVPVKLMHAPEGLGGITFHAYDLLRREATECNAAHASQLPEPIRLGLGEATHVLDLYQPYSTFDLPGIEVWSVQGALQQRANRTLHAFGVVGDQIYHAAAYVSVLPLPGGTPVSLSLNPTRLDDLPTDSIRKLYALRQSRAAQGTDGVSTR